MQFHTLLKTRWGVRLTRYALGVSPKGERPTTGWQPSWCCFFTRFLARTCAKAVSSHDSHSGRLVGAGRLSGGGRMVIPPRVPVVDRCPRRAVSPNFFDRMQHGRSHICMMQLRAIRRRLQSKLPTIAHRPKNVAARWRRYTGFTKG